MIIPAVLANTEKDVQRLLELSKKTFGFVQLDIMDGEFVPSKSVGGEYFKDYDFGKLDLEVHLMVKDPLVWIPYFTAKNVKTIIFHIEIRNYFPETFVAECIKAVKKHSKKAGIAINPDTDLAQLDPFVRQIDSVLFMCVNPGFYGAPFIPEVLDKIRQFKKKHPAVATSVDGGIKKETIDQVIKTGVDSICVGSAIFNAPDPLQSYRELEKRIKELRKGDHAD